MKIIFTNIRPEVDLEEPKPALAFVPDWYKSMESYVGGIKKPDGHGVSTATAKKCIPVFDAMTSGYIITTPVDVYVSNEDGKQRIEWTGIDAIATHGIEQAPQHPVNNGKDYLKWNNLWAIKTPVGYSTLFVQPFHRESPFTILPGIVDTDSYTTAVNFPFVLNDISFSGLIPAGTPMVQVIPFKRESWKMAIGGAEEIKESQRVKSKLSTRFFNKYKLMFWNKKDYK